MKVFIEVSAGTDQRPVYNEKTLEYQKTIKVNSPYPYAYGFLLDTLGGDEKCLDCYIITSRQLKSGIIVDVEPVGMVEYIEDGQEDNKILAIFPDEDIFVGSEVEERIRKFNDHYFENRSDKTTSIGRFLGYNEAIAYIDRCKIKK